MPVLHDLAPIALAQRCAAGAVIAGTIALGGFRMRALTRSGAVAAVIVGALAFAFGGLLVAGAIVIFFGSGSLLGRARNTTATLARGLAPKAGRRDAVQVFANGGVACACVIAGSIAAVHGWHGASHWMVAAVCAIAAASGDTWSTEIGAFVHGQARRITDMQAVPAGTSGGVTVLGTLAAPLGGAIVGLAGIFGRDILSVQAWVSLCALVGIAGSLADSVLGATLQGTWHCSNCGQTIETPVHGACGASGTPHSGLSWLDNDGVNALTTAVGAAIGYLIAAPFVASHAAWSWTLASVTPLTA